MHLGLTSKTQKPSPCFPLSQPSLLLRPVLRPWGSRLEHSHPSHMVPCSRPVKMNQPLCFVLISGVGSDLDKFLDYWFKILDRAEHERINTHLTLSPTFSQLQSYLQNVPKY